MLVHQILKTKAHDGVITITPGTAVAEAAKLLSSKRIGAVIISKDGRVPLGILSERDIVRELGKRGTGCLKDPVEDMMTADLVGCSTDDSTEILLQKMTDGRFRHIPVIDGGIMIGLISIGDVVKARLDELAHENDALQGMIMGH